MISNCFEILSSNREPQVSQLCKQGREQPILCLLYIVSQDSCSVKALNTFHSNADLD